MNYVKINNTVFMPINNTLNSFCYHLTVVQQLHLSETFNNLVRSYTSGNQYIDTMLEPFKVYANATVENHMEIYKQMKESYQKLISTIISEHGKNGYSPFILMYFYILPIVYRCFKNQFKQICQEASIDPIFLLNPDVSIEAQIETCPLIKNEYIEEQKKMTREMNEAKIDFEKGPFRGGILEVYPNKHSFDGGHALFILKDKETYYIFDDDTTIDMFKNYVNKRNGYIAKVCIRGIDEKSAEELQQLWGERILINKVNNRCEFIDNGEDDKMDKLVCSFVRIHILPPTPITTEMQGGDVSSNKPKLVLTIVSTLMLIAVIILIIIVLIRSKRSTNLVNSKNATSSSSNAKP